MIASEPTTPPGAASGKTKAAGGAGSSDQPVSILRGAGVNADARRAGTLVVAVSLVALAVVTAVLFAVGASKNSQINSLRSHGVPTEVTVTKCIGLLGGSGSNAAGYACRGTFAVDGHQYNEAIPGNSSLAPGTTVRGVIVPGNPPLLSTAKAVATERASWRVFIVPTILLIVLVLLVGILVFRRRRVHRAG
jgi:hypothetical protein